MTQLMFLLLLFPCISFAKEVVSYKKFVEDNREQWLELYRMYRDENSNYVHVLDLKLPPPTNISLEETHNQYRARDEYSEFVAFSREAHYWDPMNRRVLDKNLIPPFQRMPNDRINRTITFLREMNNAFYWTFHHSYNKSYIEYSNCFQQVELLDPVEKHFFKKEFQKNFGSRTTDITTPDQTRGKDNLIAGIRNLNEIRPFFSEHLQIRKENMRRKEDDAKREGLLVKLLTFLGWKQSAIIVVMSFICTRLLLLSLLVTPSFLKPAVFKDIIWKQNLNQCTKEVKNFNQLWKTATIFSEDIGHLQAELHKKFKNEIEHFHEHPNLAEDWDWNQPNIDVEALKKLVGNVRNVNIVQPTHTLRRISSDLKRMNLFLEKNTF